MTYHDSQVSPLLEIKESRGHLKSEAGTELRGEGFPPHYKLHESNKYNIVIHNQFTSKLKSEKKIPVAFAIEAGTNFSFTEVM